MNENLVNWINEETDKLDNENLRLIYDVGHKLGQQQLHFVVGLVYAYVDGSNVVLCREYEDDFGDVEMHIPKHLFLEPDPIEAARKLMHQFSELMLNDRKNLLVNRIEHRVAEIKRLQEEVDKMNKEISSISLSLADSVSQS